MVAKRKVLRDVTLLLVVAGLLGGCSTLTSTPADELSFLLEALNHHNKTRAEARERAQLHGIKRLEVHEDLETGELTVSVLLNKADLAVVMGKVLRESGVFHSEAGDVLFGEISVQFEDLPFLEALNRLLNPLGYACVYEGGIYVIDFDDFDDFDDALQTVQVPLRYSDVEDAIEVLDSLSDYDVEAIGVPGTNTVLLSGDARDVRSLVKLLRRMDIKRPHVLLEVLMISYRSSAFEIMNSRITEGSATELNDVTMQFSGDPGVFPIDFTFEELVGEAGPDRFRALISLMVAMGKAQLVSRVYAAGLSGEEAKIDITNDMSVRIEAAVEGVNVSSTESFVVGTKVTITPTVMAGGLIRMEMYLEDSEFVPSAGTVVVSLDANIAETTVQVPSGQAVVVGGLISNRSRSTNAGLPILRRIPGLSMIFGEQQRDAEGKEVVFVVVPYIWEPSMTPPLYRPKSFTKVRKQHFLESWIRMPK